MAGVAPAWPVLYGVQTIETCSFETTFLDKTLSFETTFM